MIQSKYENLEEKFGGDKMIPINYHIHSTYCDGKNTLEEMVQAAIKKGLISIGITSHMTLPFENDWSLRKEKLQDYFDEIDALKVKYADEIEIYKSLEIDYFMDRKGISRASEKVLSKLDYVLMSIHSLGSTRVQKLYHIDESPENFKTGIEKYYDGNVKAFVCDYYESIGEMAMKYRPDIIGHLDLIKKNNNGNLFFNDQEAWYQEAVCNCLDRILESGSIVEINTGANMRAPGVGRYPSDWIVPKMKKRNIPITICGDSHSVAGIANGYEEAKKYLLDCGYKEYWRLKEGSWEPCLFGE